MKIDLVTPVDIRYSFRATERLVYEYALFLKENGLDVRVLVPEYTNVHKPQKVVGYRKIEERYKSLETVRVVGKKFCLPLKYDLYSYENVPTDSIVYFPYSPYNHILNIITKPKGQIYVIGSHSLHLKNGRLLVGKTFLEDAFNGIMQLLLRGDEVSKNVYYHTLTEEQTRYLETLGIHKDKIFCIPNFVEVRDFRISDNKSKPLHVMHIGGMQKDSQAIVPIIERLAESKQIENFVFHFIGEKQPESLTERAGNHSVVLHGAVSDADKVRLLSEMDAMILPAAETGAVAMLEGLASGLYIISRDNYVAKRVSGRGARVALVGSGDTATYCKALINAYDMKQKHELNNKVKKENRRIVERLFDKPIVLRQIKAMFEKINK